jgi:hypothetical protein
VLSVRDLRLKGEDLVMAEREGVVGWVAVVAGMDLVRDGWRLSRCRITGRVRQLSRDKKR